jgi:hypothetical protein
MKYNIQLPYFDWWLLKKTRRRSLDDGFTLPIDFGFGYPREDVRKGSRGSGDW